MTNPAASWLRTSIQNLPSRVSKVRRFLQHWAAIANPTGNPIDYLFNAYLWIPEHSSRLARVIQQGAGSFISPGEYRSDPNRCPN